VNDEKLIWGLGLLGAAVLLLVLEVFVPSGGAILFTACAVGVAGVVCMWMADPLWGVLSLVFMVIAGPTVFFYGLSLWRHTPLGRKMIGELTEEEVEKRRLEELHARDEQLKLVGVEGTAATDLRPVGVVLINGKRYDALAELGLIPAGTRVRVTVVESNQLKVRAVG
jgi:membrane-bound serine protease (ClpP class)